MFLLLYCCALPDLGAALPEPPLPFHLVSVGQLDHPTALAAPPGRGTTLFATQQEGKLWRLTEGKAELVGDITSAVTYGGERGLLGLALHPRWPEDPRVFVNYTRTEAGQLRTRIASYVMRAPSPGGLPALDPASMVELIGYDQPFTNHNSGSLTFGPDGYLYAGVGDGGSAGDPHSTGQNAGDLLGSILRLDVSSVPYGIPADNPFVGKPDARPEVWAFGVRNPWGMHFDEATLWFADVGQNMYEEVNRGAKGANYGWNRMEGLHCFNTETCSLEGLTPPVAEYDHTVGSSVTGGVVYRGPSIPALDGRYLYADYATGVMFAIRAGEGAKQGGAADRLGRLPMHPSTFGTDGDGNVYIAAYGGSVYKITP